MGSKDALPFQRDDTTCMGDCTNAATERYKAEHAADLKTKRTIFNKHFKPDTPRVQHSKTAVLLLYWDKSDLKNLKEEVSDIYLYHVSSK